MSEHGADAPKPAAEDSKIRPDLATLPMIKSTMINAKEMPLKFCIATQCPVLSGVNGPQ